MIIANVFDHSGLMKRLTYRCILLVGGSYKGMLYGIAVTGIIMGICIPNIGGRGALYAALAFGLCKALSLKPQGKAAGSVMLAAAVAATMPAYMFLTDLGIVGLNGSGQFCAGVHAVLAEMVPLCGTAAFGLAVFQHLADHQIVQAGRDAGKQGLF